MSQNQVSPTKKKALLSIQTFEIENGSVFKSKENPTGGIGSGPWLIFCETGGIGSGPCANYRRDWLRTVADLL